VRPLGVDNRKTILSPHDKSLHPDAVIHRMP